MKNLMGVWSDCPHSWQERQKLMNCEMYSQENKDSRENPDSVKTHTEKHKHVSFILQVHLQKQKIHFDYNCQYTQSLFLESIYIGTPSL